MVSFFDVTNRLYNFFHPINIDIGGEPNQVFMNQGAQSNTDHYLEDPLTSAGSGSLTSPPGSTPSPGASFSNPMLYNMDELLRMKRKEKHMAPIDCSGVGT